MPIVAPVAHIYGTLTFPTASATATSATASAGSGGRSGPVGVAILARQEPQQQQPITAPVIPQDHVMGGELSTTPGATNMDNIGASTPTSTSPEDTNSMGIGRSIIVGNDSVVAIVPKGYGTCKLSDLGSGWILSWIIAFGGLLIIVALGGTVFLVFKEYRKKRLMAAEARKAEANGHGPANLGPGGQTLGVSRGPQDIKSAPDMLQTV